jgi:hypothetical protein
MYYEFKKPVLQKDCIDMHAEINGAAKTPLHLPPTA